MKRRSLSQFPTHLSSNSKLVERRGSCCKWELEDGGNLVISLALMKINGRRRFERREMRGRELRMERKGVRARAALFLTLSFFFRARSVSALFSADTVPLADGE